VGVDEFGAVVRVDADDREREPPDGLDDPQFGYRLTADELKDQGFVVWENRVWRPSSGQKPWSNHAKKRGLNRRPGPPVHDDPVKRDFSATRANELWIGALPLPSLIIRPVRVSFTPVSSRTSSPSGSSDT
jgi:hypothetical protein